MGRRTIVLFVALILAAVSAFAVWRYLSTVEDNVRRDIAEVVVWRTTQPIETGTEGQLIVDNLWIVESSELVEFVAFEGSDIFCGGPVLKDGRRPGRAAGMPSRQPGRHRAVPFRQGRGRTDFTESGHQRRHVRQAERTERHQVLRIARPGQGCDLLQARRGGRRRRSDPSWRQDQRDRLCRDPDQLASRRCWPIRNCARRCSSQGSARMCADISQSEPGHGHCLRPTETQEDALADSPAPFPARSSSPRPCCKKSESWQLVPSSKTASLAEG